MYGTYTTIAAGGNDIIVVELSRCQVTMSRMAGIRPYTLFSLLKERSRPSVSNVKSADVRIATTLSKGRHWFTSRNPSVNGTDCIVPKLFNVTDETAPLSLQPVWSYFSKGT